uniref:Uncharacterized protein n=1 Tax=Anguilla anguilla TaxID=7936 RepID=A0A0E9RXG3_ANGAN
MCDKYIREQPIRHAPSVMLRSNKGKGFFCVCGSATEITHAMIKNT